MPNEAFAGLVNPMNEYLFPLLIAYIGGKMVYAKRGSVVSAVSLMGLIVGLKFQSFLRR